MISSSTNTKQQRRSSVTFSETSQLILVRNLSSDAPDKYDLWCTPDELEAYKRDVALYRRVVRLSISKRFTPSASDILGLEKFLTPQLTQEYANRRYIQTKRVLEEARMQDAQGKGLPRSNQDIKRLARISAVHSKWARERARAAGLFLAQDQEEEAQQEKALQMQRSQMIVDDTRHED